MTDKASKSGADASQDESATDGPDKGKSLSEHMAEFQAALASKGKDAPDKGDKSIDELRNDLNQLLQAEADRNLEQEMQSFLVPTVKGELEIDDELVRDWILKRADKDPELTELWQHRDKQRSKFDEAIKGLAPEFQKYAEAKNLLHGESSNRSGNKLKAALRSSRETPTGLRDYSTADLEAMNDHEFNLHKAEVFRLAASGQL